MLYIYSSHALDAKFVIQHRQHSGKSVRGMHPNAFHFQRFRFFRQESNLHRPPRLWSSAFNSKCLFQTSNFSCAKSNVSELKSLFKFICIRFGTWKVRRLKQALATGDIASGRRCEFPYVKCYFALPSFNWDILFTEFSYINAFIYCLIPTTKEIVNVINNETWKTMLFVRSPVQSAASWEHKCLEVQC